MHNNTVTNISDYQIISVKYLIAARINSSLILLENLSVVLCLCMNKKIFYKQEFWLLLVCLTLNDILCGIAMMFATFIQSDVLHQDRTLCIFLMFLCQISQMCMLLNVLSICVYRFTLIACADKFRFGWKVWMSVVQISVTFVFSCVYCTIPFLAWSRKELVRVGCDMVNVFGENLNKAYVFVCSGLLLPLLLLNLLYLVTILLLRQVNKNKGSKCLRKLYARKFTVDKNKARKTTDDKGNGYTENKPNAKRKGNIFIGLDHQQVNATIATRDTDVCGCELSKQTLNRNIHL